MTAAHVPMVIYQGEDWTTQVVWTDEYDEPVIVVHPCRMDVKTQLGRRSSPWSRWWSLRRTQSQGST